MKLRAADFLVVRTPLLPRDVLTALSADLSAPSAIGEGDDLAVALAQDRTRVTERLRSLVADPAVREGLFVSSPSIDEALERWLARPIAEASAEVTASLLRYLMRMSSRCTPFGLFAGSSLGKRGDATRIELEPRAAYRRRSRLDMQYLVSLCDDLSARPALRADLPVSPNQSAYRTETEVRYSERILDPVTQTHAHRLVAMKRTEYFDLVLERAERGASPADLAQALLDWQPELTMDEARDYVDGLIASQILTSDLEPAITGPEPVLGLVDLLRTSKAGEAAADTLAQAERALRELDAAGPGQTPARYHAIVEGLSALPTRPQPGCVFQVDLYKPMREASLGPEVYRELEHAVSLLVRTARPRADDSLDRFRASFHERYERARVPLSVALDDELGVGFPSRYAASSVPAPLLRDIEFPKDPEDLANTPEQDQPQLAFGRREAHLLRRLEEHGRTRAEWVLDDADVERLASPRAARVPDSFAVMATVAAASSEACARGDFRVWLRCLEMPGARLLGRFCQGDDDLRRAVAAYCKEEEAARPDAIHAEIVHLPQPRTGNILCRPALRTFEIPYLGRSGVPRQQQIPISDLDVSVDGAGRITLWSRRFDREVVPTLSAAHIWWRQGPAIYRFLGALQHERDPMSLAFSWGPLASAPFLPRVRLGRVVIAPARWNLADDQVALLVRDTPEGRYRSVQRLRAALGLPRWVGLTERGGNVFPLDLDSALHVDVFIQLASARARLHGSVALVEVRDREELLATGPEGRFDHEVIVPYLAERPTTPAPRVPAPPVLSRPPARTNTPGSDWLYAKLYVGAAGTDGALRELVRPLVEAGRESGAIQGWFFIRYGDPHLHVRVRMRGRKERLLHETLPALHAALKPFLRDGRVWKLQLDTYEREIERYGGPAGIALAERIFEADSDAVVGILDAFASDEAERSRWLVALRGVHVLLTDLDLDLERRTRVVERARRKFALEHHLEVGNETTTGGTATKVFERSLGQRYRGERSAIDSMLADSDRARAAHPTLEPAFRFLSARSRRLVRVAKRLHAEASQGRLTVTVEALAESLVHMHVNRLLQTSHRAQELVLYDFLLRAYGSERARQGRLPRS